MNGYMLHKKKSLTIKIKQKHIANMSMLLNTAIYNSCFLRNYLHM